jgi:hypothetical protein
MELDELKDRMINLRESEPEDVPAWLGLHYTCFTLDGSTLLNERDLGRYPDFKPSTLEGLLRAKKKDHLKSALYG